MVPRLGLGLCPDCIVVGGGAIGLAIARRLAGTGLSIVLVERGRCGSETSWSGAGVLAPCNPNRRDSVAKLRDESLRLYPAFCEEMLSETGIDPEYEACGELEIALNSDALRSLQENAAAGAGQLDPLGEPSYEFLEVEATCALEPVVSREILGSLLCRRTAQVRNPRLLRALIAACKQRGVHTIENCAAREVVVEGGRVTGLRTEQGIIACSKIVLCAGPWSASIETGSVPLPVHPVRGQMILLKFERRPFRRVIARGKTYLVPRRDGHVLLGATEEHDGSFSRRNTASGIAGLIQTAVKLVPLVAEATMVTQWTGLRPGTPDDNPIIGHVPGCDGLIAATGHYRAGLILTPITAELVCRMVLGQPVDLDLSACRPGRSFR